MKVCEMCDLCRKEVVCEMCDLCIACIAWRRLSSAPNASCGVLSAPFMYHIIFVHQMEWVFHDAGLIVAARVGLV